MDRHQISATLSEIAEVLEIRGENPFKIRAYQNAARIVEGLTNLEELINSKKLTTVKGIGKNLADHITELFETGHLKEFETMLKSIPGGLFEMLAIPGVGAKKIKIFWEKLGITNIGELEYACKENRLRDLPGFGQKSQDKILQGISFHKKHEGKYLYPYAVDSAEPVFKAIEAVKDVEEISIAGSLRRLKEIVKDIDILVATRSPKKVMNAFVNLPFVDQIVQHGDTKSSVVLRTGMSADLRCVSGKEFPYALHHFTGSKEHNTAMRARAKKMLIKMNEYGLFKDEKNIPCKAETDIFKKLGLDFIPPELRENMGEIEAAENGTLPKLIEESDLVGVLHVHTSYSDGTESIIGMAEAAKKRGYKYIGICDHSKSASYAGGLKPEDLKRQHEEIDALNKELKGITVLKGIESDILPDGSLDYDDEIMDSFDFAIASVHSKFSMNEKEMTDRICRALKHPAVSILGHPTGRLLLARDAYPVDMRRVISVAAEYGKAIELNANPYRLDIDWRLGPYVKEKGVKIAICPDAHNTNGLDDIRYGIGIARKGWFEKEDVINAWSLEMFLKWLNS